MGIACLILQVFNERMTGPSAMTCGLLRISKNNSVRPAEEICREMR